MWVNYMEIELEQIADPGSHLGVRFLVNARTLLTVVPMSLHNWLGIEPVGERRFRGLAGVVQ